MKSLRLTTLVLLCLTPAAGLFAQTGGTESKPPFVKFRTDPPGGIVIVNGNTVKTSDSDVVWTKIDLPSGTHAVIVKGEAKKLTFDLPVDQKRGTYVTIDFDDDQVWSLLEKAYRSTLLASTSEPDNSTTVTKRKKPKEDSTAVASKKDAKTPSTSSHLPGINENIETDQMPILTTNVDPNFKDSINIEDLIGNVIIKALIDDKGNVADAKVETSCGNKGYDQAALDAAKLCKYKPATRRGKPVAVWVTYSVPYKRSHAK